MNQPVLAGKNQLFPYRHPTIIISCAAIPGSFGNNIQPKDALIVRPPYAGRSLEYLFILYGLFISGSY